MNRGFARRIRPVDTSLNPNAYSDALVVLGTAGIVVPLLRRWGLNPILSYLGAGALLGPLGLGALAKSFPFVNWFTVVDKTNIAGIADLGVVFLLFLIGLELSFNRLVAMRRLVVGLGGLQVLLTSALLAGVAALAGQKPAVAVIVGASLSLSSTAFVLELLAAQERLTTSVGRGAFSVLLAQDLAVIPVLLLISLLGTHAGGSLAADLLVALLQAAFGIVCIILAGRFLLRPLLHLVAGTRSAEVFVAAVMFTVLGAGVIAGVAGLPMPLGAFVAGLMLAETEYGKAVVTTIKPFKGLLLGVFFFTVGMNIDTRELVREPVWLLAAVTGLIALKALLLTALAKLFRLSWPAALEIGLLLASGGEFAFVSIGLASAIGLIDGPLATFTLVVTSLTMVLTPLLAAAARRLASLLPAQRSVDPTLAIRPPGGERHAIVVGYGRVGKVVCSLLDRHGIRYIAVDHDAPTVARDRRDGHAVYFGDASEPGFLESCGLQGATGVVITIHMQEAIDDIVGHVRAARPDMLIVSRARDADHARHLYRIGATDAVPETVEASLQLSEAALVGLGIAIGPAIASIHEKRDEVRSALQNAARAAGRREFRPPSKTARRR
jgi:CPA2 family monovalent cation:H+ antiporter-2